MSIRAHMRYVWAFNLLISYLSFHFSFSLYFFFSFFIIQSNDDTDKQNSPFDTNGMKKDENSTNGVVMNGIDDDKGFK